eukprot:TRINITY_DN5036_c0_g1_i2.p1 TRINITY_DN5036_c0_g1~~TRINITY_DN5036_c0_g1_i2.p1  ORF type:complete len:1093 (+),score=245.80 TRINITY_DN5036_c0_g1_i2:1175-4453(+)
MTEVRQERELSKQLNLAKLTNAQAQDVLVGCGAAPSLLRYDVRSTAVVFANDLEKDSTYQRWPRSLRELNSNAGWPGQVRQIARNMLTLVYVIDPASSAGNRMLGTMLHHVYQMAPMRVGFVLDVSASLQNGDIPSDKAHVAEHLSLYMARAYSFLAQQNPQLGVGFLHACFMYRPMINQMGERAPLTADAVRQAFDRVSSQVSQRKPFETVVLSNKLDDEYIRGWLEFVSAKNIAGRDTTLFVNGIMLSGNDADANLFAVLSHEQNIVRTLFNDDVLSDKSNIYSYFMSTAVDHFSPIAIPASPANVTFVNLLTSPAAVRQLDQFSASVGYLTAPDTAAEPKPVTVWVFCDLASAHCAANMRSAVQFVASSTRDRVALIHVGDASLPAAAFVKAITSVASTAVSLDVLQRVLGKWADSEEFSATAAEELAADAGLDLPRDKQDLLSQLAFARTILPPTSTDAVTVVINARLVHLPQDVEFTPGDWSVLTSYDFQMRTSCVVNALKDAPLSAVSAQAHSDIFLLASAVVGKFDNILQGRSLLNVPRDLEGMYRNTGDDSVSVEAILNPVSPDSRKAVAMLMLLRDAFNASVTLLLNPPADVWEMPIKSFYRYVAVSSLAFDSQIAEASARFTHLPADTLLTLHLHSPHSWLVEAVTAVHDLDNIKLSAAGGNVYALFELRHLLVEGHCGERPTNSPPRGLELLLGTVQQPHLQDTLVMANLGYFQLKANPGVWRLTLAASRSSELYSIDNDGLDVIVADYYGVTVSLPVTKRAGKELDQLLPPADSPPPASMWDTISSYWKKTPAATDASVQLSNRTVHVFSIASGHLYERFLKIMILSVMKHTSPPVKFWLIGNWLSPAFKAFLPHMAARYGFEFELIQYKWPSWLKEQTEKQRIIWGYKILFLDVIFPLDLEKVIFIDADQVIRSDIRELYELDIGGAPLAFTPFCDSNTETEGFRFWKHGFWHDHLRGKPYHISALFVVDLHRFRQLGAGDQFRMVYENLVRDPNSLSNLDQDLPNYAQHMVPIFSLPQEWLWCETWCDDVSKQRAKTIDLCNNPLTKRPKLDAARAVIVEWPLLDQEVKALEAEIAQQ